MIALTISPLEAYGTVMSIVDFIKNKGFKLYCGGEMHHRFPLQYYAIYLFSFRIGQF